ncbi:peptidoglycan-binding protein [Streptomyces sp. NPDC002125]
MTSFHVAVDHIDPDTSEPTTTYYGTCDQAHADEVRAIAALDDSERHVLEHPRLAGVFMVLRDDGDLDVYVPKDAAEYRVFEPDADAKEGVLENLPRGAAGPAYISGATKMGGQAIGGAMDTPGNPPRVTWHTTESPAGGSYLTSISAYLIRVGAEPQVVYDPVTDGLVQLGPLTKSGRALRNDGSRRTNREGKVNIQVEVLGRARSPWTKNFDPAKKPNYRKLIAAMRAHGVPDTWPAGKPAATAAAATNRNRTTWQSKGGHYGHSQVPGNDHWDPGAIDISIVPGKASGGSDSGGGSSTPETPVKPTGKDAFPGASKFGSGANNEYVTRLGQMLVKRGGKRFYSVGPGPKWGNADKAATKAFQKAQGWSGSDADGIPGATTWEYLVKGTGKDIPAAVTSQPLEPFPGASFFHGGRHSSVITAMGRRLVAEGCGKYKSGPGPNWTNADRASYKAWQQKLGYTGSDANGIPGATSWAKLRVPNS